MLCTHVWVSLFSFSLAERDKLSILDDNDVLQYILRSQVFRDCTFVRLALQFQSRRKFNSLNGMENIQHTSHEWLRMKMSIFCFRRFQNPSACFGNQLFLLADFCSILNTTKSTNDTISAAVIERIRYLESSFYSDYIVCELRHEHSVAKAVLGFLHKSIKTNTLFLFLFLHRRCWQCHLQKTRTPA